MQSDALVIVSDGFEPVSKFEGDLSLSPRHTNR